MSQNEKKLWFAMTANEFYKYIQEKDRFKIVTLLNWEEIMVTEEICTKEEFFDSLKEKEDEGLLVELSDFSAAINPFYQKYGEQLHEKMRIYNLL